MYKHLLKPLAFLLPPEMAHKYTTLLLPFYNFFNQKRTYNTNRHPNLIKDMLGLEFPNPIGLAAGFDKNGKHIAALSHLGFGFIEVGTVTPRPQPGNIKPRLFRLPHDEALINRMGFNNHGVDAMVKRLKKVDKRKCVIGANIGKNKATPLADAARDYCICFNKLFHHVDYFVINVSSPNTPGLRSLQEKEPLSKILQAVQQINKKKNRPKPILLKVSPDLSETTLIDALDVAVTNGLQGIVATNTTISRENAKTTKTEILLAEDGGLSGAPLFEKALHSVKFIREHAPADFVIIGVGGINSPKRAKAMLNAGANLIQIYTGLIYEGPGLITAINKALILETRIKGKANH